MKQQKTKKSAEKKMMKEIENGAWKSIKNLKDVKSKLKATAKETIKKRKLGMGSLLDVKGKIKWSGNLNKMREI